MARLVAVPNVHSIPDVSFIEKTSTVAARAG
jgi:hypothetical protein